MCVGREGRGSVARCLAPAGQGALRRGVGDAVCPKGKSAALEARPFFLGVVGGAGFGAVCLSGSLGGRAGDGGRGCAAVYCGTLYVAAMPQGGTAGSARTRSRVQTLENPFLGNRHPFSRGPVPTAAGGMPPSMPVYTLSGTQQCPHTPYPCGMGASTRAEGTGCRHCRPWPGQKR